MTTEGTRGHAFDGIEEFDNRLPNWWLWSFYIACIFSVIYWVYYHTLDIGNSPHEEYAVAQAEAALILEENAKNNPVTNESLIALAKNPAIVEEGRKIFHDPIRCALCHEPDGRGKPGLGPNLTDQFWVYGNQPMDIYTTILKGRAPDPEKGFIGGMQAWDVHGPLFVQRATAYVMSIMDTNVPGRAPESNAKKMPKSWQ